MTEKRRLFDELMQGIESMQQQREGKITLRSHEAEKLPPHTPEVNDKNPAEMRLDRVLDISPLGAIQREAVPQ